MNGLHTARVVVIDDTVEEAQPIISSFGRAGIPVMYCAGVGYHPPEPLEGVRLVFVDLYMVGTPDIHANVQTAIDLLAKVVDTNEAGIGLVFWTTHSESDKNTFRSALSERLPDFVPAFIIDQEKSAYIGEDADLNTLFNDIRAKLDEEPAHAILRNWEQAAHDAASQSTELLRSCAKDTVELQKALGAIAKAGGPINKADDAVSHLYQGLNAVLMDAVGASSRLNPGDAAHIAELQTWSEKPKRLSNEISGRINGLILLDQVDHDSVLLRPGNVYAKPWSDQKVTICPAIQLKPSIVYEETVVPCVRDKIATLINNRDKAKSGNDNKALKNHEAKLKQYDTLRERVEYVVVEVTPACDFANGKAPTAKFAGGILISQDDFKLIEKLRPELTAFLRHIGPFRLNRDGKIWRLILNAKLLYSRPWPTSATKWKPLCRIREQLLVDIQQWLASYSSRPGFFAVR